MSRMSDLHIAITDAFLAGTSATSIATLTGMPLDAVLAVCEEAYDEPFDEMCQDSRKESATEWAEYLKDFEY